MYGWRARIGVIYPASGLADHEYYQMVPEGVSVHVTRSQVPGSGEVTLETVQEVAGSESEFVRTARDLATVRPHVIAWMCTSGSFSRGAEWDKKLIRILEEASGTRAVTTSCSIVAAMEALGARRIAVGTPYEDRINVKLREYLEAQGLEVVNIKGLSCADDWEIGSYPPDVAYNLAKDVDRPEAEAVFISDTGFRMIEVAEIAELDLGKPAVNANMVTMWNALRTAGVKEPIGGLGSLFTI